MTKKNVAVIIIGAVSAILICLLVIFVIIPVSTFASSNKEMVVVSNDSGYYEKGLRVKLQAKNGWTMPGAKIYYTIDGTDPDPKPLVYAIEDTDTEIDSNSKVYGSPIRIKREKTGTSICVLKVKVKYLWMSSEVQTKTYVLGDSIESTYGLNVISITCNEADLYDYNKGIFVGGKVFEDNYQYYKDNELDGYIEGNYNLRTDEWIKDSNITLVDSKGNLVLDQRVGLSISGGTSAAMSVKSLKISADEMYDVKNPKLNLDLIYNDEYSECSQFSESSNIRLRSGSQDNTNGANIRSAVIDELAKQSGYSGRAGSERALVFVNGEFYGIFDMQYSYSNSYLKNRFSLPDSVNIEKYKQDARIEDDEETNKFFEEYYRIFNADLTVEENRKALEEFIDMDDYLLYYAINILSNNTDWPYNNFEVWRYTGGYDEKNKYTDGKFRCLIYDVDMTYMTRYNEAFIGGQSADNFVSLMEKKFAAKKSPLSNVMKCTEYRDKLVMIISDLLNTSFKADNVNRIIEKEYAKIAKSVKLLLGDDAVKEKEVYVQLMHQAVNEREAEIRQDFANYFGLNETYAMNLIISNGLKVSWNNMKLYGEMNIYSDQITTYSNNYYKGVSFKMTAEESPMYSFKGWLVNGKLYEENELVITPDMIENGNLNIEALSEIRMGDCLRIEEVYYGENENWLVVKNYGMTDINLKNYYITDSESRVKSFKLADITIGAGEMYVINGRNSLGDTHSVFNFEKFETFYLTDGENVCDSITIPRMSETESYKRFNGSNDFVFSKR